MSDRDEVWYNRREDKIYVLSKDNIVSENGPDHCLISFEDEGGYEYIFSKKQVGERILEKEGRCLVWVFVSFIDRLGPKRVVFSSNIDEDLMIDNRYQEFLVEAH